MLIEVEIRSREREQFINISDELNKLIAEAKIKDGCCTVFVPHTTAALTINENADPDVMQDLLEYLGKLVPLKGGYRHREGNSDAHIKAALLGSSLHLLIKNGYLDLGTWQGVYLAEFDGPRCRKVKVWAE